MTTYTEGRHNGEFIMSEASGQRSRDNVTIVSGAGNLKPGTVLGKITASGKYKAVTVAAADGSQNPVAVLINWADASSADVSAAVLNADAEVNKNLLSYGADVDTAGEITTVLAALQTATGIKAR